MLKRLMAFGRCSALFATLAALSYSGCGSEGSSGSGAGAGGTASGCTGTCMPGATCTINPPPGSAAPSVLCGCTAARKWCCDGNCSGTGGSGGTGGTGATGGTGGTGATGGTGGTGATAGTGGTGATAGTSGVGGTGAQAGSGGSGGSGGQCARIGQACRGASGAICCPGARCNGDSRGGMCVADPVDAGGDAACTPDAPPGGVRCGTATCAAGEICVVPCCGGPAIDGGCTPPPRYCANASQITCPRCDSTCRDRAGCFGLLQNGLLSCQCA